MSDHDTLPPEIDDEIRARMRSFAQEITQRTDTEAALQRMPRRSRPSIRLLAIAACLIAVAAAAAVVIAERQSVNTITPLQSPPTESSTTTTKAGGSTILAKGENVKTERFAELTGQTLNIDAAERDGKVTGEFRVNNVVVTLQCAGTRKLTGPETNWRDPDWRNWRDLILGGQVTQDPDGQGFLADDDRVTEGDVVALIIRKDDPPMSTSPNGRGPAARPSYRVTLHADHTAGSCTDLVDSVPVNLDGGFFNDLANGDDIETR